MRTSQDSLSTAWTPIVANLSLPQGGKPRSARLRLRPPIDLEPPPLCPSKTSTSPDTRKPLPFHLGTQSLSIPLYLEIRRTLYNLQKALHYPFTLSFTFQTLIDDLLCVRLHPQQQLPPGRLSVEEAAFTPAKGDNMTF